MMRRRQKDTVGTYRKQENESGRTPDRDEVPRKSPGNRHEDNAKEQKLS